mmetsp:Transcript_43527/g.114885  ORF Transcript_43527/g.114885 Transcript_43527/m.114885 type:complete len:242 (-) Transcript_43527:45-770(-)
MCLYLRVRPSTWADPNSLKLRCSSTKPGRKSSGSSSLPALLALPTAPLLFVFTMCSNTASRSRSKHAICVHRCCTSFNNRLVSMSASSKRCFRRDTIGASCRWNLDIWPCTFLSKNRISLSRASSTRASRPRRSSTAMVPAHSSRSAAPRVQRASSNSALRGSTRSASSVSRASSTSLRSAQRWVSALYKAWMFCISVCKRCMSRTSTLTGVAMSMRDASSTVGQEECVSENAQVSKQPVR